MKSCCILLHNKGASIVKGTRLVWDFTSSELNGVCVGG